MGDLPNNINYKSIGKKIKELRLEHNLTQEELAEKINRSRNFITKLETNQTFVSLESMVNLAVVLNTSVDYLLFDSLELDKSEYDILIDNYIKNFSEKEKEILIYLIKSIKLFYQS